MPADLSILLEAWKAGDADAGERVIEQTYAELRRVAHGFLRHERRHHTLQTTALLHEAYLRLLRKGPGTADTRDAFFRLMAGEMRRRLIDHARRRLASKRGSGAVHEQISTSTTVAGPAPPEDIEAVLARLDKALVELSAKFPRTAHVVQLRFLVGLTAEEAATELGLSPATVKREWTFARAWLAAAMETPTAPASRQP